MENKINQVCEEEVKQTADTGVCPDQASLKQEILNRTKFSNKSYANKSPPEYPEAIEHSHIYLGMAINKETDRISLRPKVLLFSSRLKGPLDIQLCNSQEFKTFLE